jgi:hypothetical protein
LPRSSVRRLAPSSASRCRGALQDFANELISVGYAVSKRGAQAAPIQPSGGQITNDDQEVEIAVRPRTPDDL